MTIDDIEREIDLARYYIRMLEQRREMMLKIEAGRRASARIQTEKLIERCKK
jgi:hypothetical protein